MTTYDTYTVTADRKTGAWIDSPTLTGKTDRAEWDARQDAANVHYDTYQHDEETRAITVMWID